MPPTLNAAQLLLIVAEILDTLKTDGFLTPTGFDDTKLQSVQDVLLLATTIEGILTKHGVTVPPKIDAVIKALPLLVALEQALGK